MECLGSGSGTTKIDVDAVKYSTSKNSAAVYTCFLFNCWVFDISVDNIFSFTITSAI